VVELKVSFSIEILEIFGGEVSMVKLTVEEPITL